MSSFNKREELFNIPVTDYSELDLIRQDFEPYAALWNMAFVFQSSHSAWLTGNFVDLDGAKMEVSVQQWCVFLRESSSGFLTHISFILPLLCVSPSHRVFL